MKIMLNLQWRGRWYIHSLRKSSYRSHGHRHQHERFHRLPHYSQHQDPLRCPLPVAGCLCATWGSTWSVECYDNLYTRAYLGSRLTGASYKLGTYIYHGIRLFRAYNLGYNKYVYWGVISIETSSLLGHHTSWNAIFSRIAKVKCLLVCYFNCHYDWATRGHNEKFGKKLVKKSVMDDWKLWWNCECQKYTKL